MSSVTLSRRQVLAGGVAGVAGVSLGLNLLRSRAAAAPTADGLVPLIAKQVNPPPSYKDWRDVYAEKWRWDRIARTSHARSNCISACSWNVFVKDGVAWREEQNAIYAQTEPGVPDYNPRGCQKGACYTHLMYEPSRVTHPLKRVGERGSGQWKRVSWDEALQTVADAMIDAAVEQNTGAIIYDHGTTNIDFGADTAAEMRLFRQLNSTVIDSWGGVGDMPYGAVQTWGMYNVEGTSNDWFKSDFIMVWVGNPAYTRIPEVHFMHEARYRGARMVVVAPDYNATAIHADTWLHPRVGTDAALALAMAQVIIAENLLKADYVREQTDLPILVREDNGRYLRAADLQAGGSDALLYFWDETAGALAPVPGCRGDGSRTIALGAVRPALAGRWTVSLADGSSVAVRPLLVHLREHLDKQYTPEQAAKITGVGPNTIRRVARELAAAPRAMIYASWGSCKHFHSDLFQRSQILLMALTGNQGKSGGGLRIASWWPIKGFDMLAGGMDSLPVTQKLRAAVMMALGRWGWRDMESLLIETTRKRGDVPLMPFLYTHAGYNTIWDKAEWTDPALPRPTAAYMKEALEKDWIQVRPLPGTEPRVFLFTGPNPLRRWPSPQVAKAHLWPKLKMVVDVNFKVGTSGLHADVILPASGYYERDSLKYSQAYLPFLLACEKAVDPLGESKPEWEIFGLLARKIQERAQARGVSTVKDVMGGEVDLATVYDRWSDDGKFHEKDPRAALDFILRNTPVTGNKGWDEMLERGMLPIVAQDGGPNVLYAVATDFDPKRTLYPHARFIEKKEVWPTLTGRQQFLLDHPWYLEAGEALPVHKEAPRAGGNYPLRLTGGHTRWSIHATWRDSSLMLRLQRGEPAVFVSPRDAQMRGIGDGDRVRVWNDNGQFQAVAKLTNGVQPGQLVIYHAWEPYQHKDWKGQGEPVVAPWKPLHLVGDYDQLHYRVIYGAPSHHPRGGTVDMERVA